MNLWKLGSISLILLTLLATLLAGAAGAQTAHLVRNLYPDDGYFTNSSPTTQYQLLAAQGKAFFLYGSQAGVTDGTPSGTQLLPVDTCSNDAQILGTLRNLFLWAGCAGSAGASLWRSDGTVAGTYQLISPSAVDVEVPEPSPGSFPDDPGYTFANGFLYFRGCEYPEGCTLWRSDGTRQGTRVVKAGERASGGVVNMGNRVFFVSTSDGFDGILAVTDGTAAGTVHLKTFEDGLRRLTAAGGKLFFLAGEHGEEELWVSDGTAAGTRVVSSFVSPRALGATRWLKAIGSRVYFLANDVEHGFELWRSDGTQAGTVRVSEIGYHAPFHPLMRTSHIEEAPGGRVVFLATDDLETYKLWATSGTPESTTLLTEVCPGDCRDTTLGFDRAVDLVPVSGGRLVFKTYSQSHRGELWSTNGTAAGTVRLSENVSAKPSLLQDAIFFFSGDRLWRTDGTPAGTRVFGGLPSGTRPSFYLHDMAMAGGRVVFQADNSRYGTDLWSTGGQPGDTNLLADVNPLSGRGSDPEELTALGGQLLFVATVPHDNPFSTGDGSIRRLWSSQGTEEATTPLPATSELGCSPDQLQKLLRAGGRVFFRGPVGSCKTRIWVTDGTSGGTQPLEIEPDVEVIFQGQLHFLVRFPDPSLGTSLWKSDGTPGGTVKLFDLPAEIHFVQGLTALGPELYFIGMDPTGEEQVWRSDGTLAGTRRVTPTLPDEHLRISQRFSPPFVRAGAFVYFTTGSSDPDSLWRSDGTPAGTIRLAQVPFPETLGQLMALKETLLFFRNIPAEESRQDVLFRSDGTPGATVRLHDFPAGMYQRYAVLGDQLLFVANDGLHGAELWKTDGTAAGTTLVRDIFPGDPSSAPEGFALAGGKIFFQANDGAHGIELWQSDGTAAGTRLVQDLNPGFGSSQPAGFTPVGGRLFFSADDGVTGRELWALPLGPAGPCQPSATALCLSGGRFRVEARWKTPEGKTDAAHAVALSSDTGYFWFFDPANVETIVKVLDGRGANGHQWVFYGALSNVEYTLTVTDTQTGIARRYFNPQGYFASVGDTHAFGPLGAAEVKRLAGAGAPLLVSERVDAAAATGACVPAAGRLCLSGGRFAVEAKWKLPDRAGTGKAKAITGDTGYFWFFDAANVEVVVKVLDATALNGRFWVFYGALSNVEYELTVTDTVTGKVRTYKNPQGRFASAGDTAAF